MSDQQAPPNGDTPAVAGPTEAPGTAQDQPQVPAGFIEEQRYKDVQAEYTRSQQRLSERDNALEWAKAALTSGDEDIRRQAFEVLGIEAPEPEEDYEDFDEFTDEQEPFLTRAEWEAYQQQQQQDQLEVQQAMENEFVAELAKDQLEQLGLPEGTNDRARLFIFNYAYGLPRLPAKPGQPELLDIKSAFDEYQALTGEVIEGWRTTKRAPHVAPGGLPANEVPDPGHGQQARLNRAMLSLRNSLGPDEQ